MIEAPSAIKYDPGYTLLFGAPGQDFAQLLCRFQVLFGTTVTLFQSRGGANHLAGLIVYDLRKQIFIASIQYQPGSPVLGSNGLTNGLNSFTQSVSFLLQPIHNLTTLRVTTLAFAQNPLRTLFFASLTGLTGFPSDLLACIANTFAFIRLWRPESANLGGHLAQFLAINAR